MCHVYFESGHVNFSKNSKRKSNILLDKIFDERDYPKNLFNADKFAPTSILYYNSEARISYLQYKIKSQYRTHIYY